MIARVLINSIFFDVIDRVHQLLNQITCTDVVRGSRPGKQVQLNEAEIRSLCTQAREIFISQPILLELEAPIKICGTYIWGKGSHFS